MAIPGPKPKGKVNIKWSADFAYAIGLIVTDGNLSISGRHINFTSKDLEQVKNFKKSLGLTNKIAKKSRGGEGVKRYYFVQFGDVLFYEFLSNIGLTPAKSKTLGSIIVPDRYFFDFLRGCFDGDGTSYSYFDPRWKSSFMFYISFASASKKHVEWLQQVIQSRKGLKGHISKSKSNSCYQLRYAKREAKEIAKNMYKKSKSLFLRRKKLKIDRSLAMMSKLSKRKHSQKEKERLTNMRG